MNLDIESRHIREVFAQYGLALYQAQCLEKGIGSLLSAPYAPTPDKMSTWRFDDLLNTNLKLTFGRLARKLREVASLPPSVEQELRCAVKARNWLAHSYWWDRAVEFDTVVGRDKMLAELQELVELFGRLKEFFMNASVKWMSDRGITQEMIEEMMDAEAANYLAGVAPPEERTRKLSKTETLVNVYFCTHMGEHGEKVTPLFELADHTLWSLCDSGLTYGPTEVDTTCLPVVPGFLEALPADIRPRPKGAANWNYRIDLSTGFYIEVSSLDEGAEFIFKWTLRKRR